MRAMKKVPLLWFIVQPGHLTFAWKNYDQKCLLACKYTVGRNVALKG